MESLVGGERKRPPSWSEAQGRIRKLKRRARDLGVPDYKFKPAPVKVYYDESVKRARSERPDLNRWL